MRSFLAVFFCLLASVSVLAQPKYEWRQIKPKSSPLARHYHDMAFDAKRGQTILFGGKFGTGYFNDTWVYDANGWRRLTPARSPEPRADHTMAYDPVRERIVLIGGTDGKSFDDTWEWDGVTWTRVATGVRSIAEGGASCYDPIQRGVFFNLGSVNMLWNGKSWSYLSVSKSRGGTSHRMVYHAGTGGPLVQDTRNPRRFRKNVGWEDIGYTRTFGLREYAMAVDPVTQHAILQGGDGSVGNSTGNGQQRTWLWTGSQWAETASIPHNRFGRSKHAMTFDLKRRVFVMFGGTLNQGGTTNETWELVRVTQRASYRGFGKGCSGTSKYLPTLGPDPILNSVPILGGAFTLRGTGLVPSQPAFLVFGASDRTWGSTALPLSLGTFGMPGCNVLASLDIIDGGARSDAAGRAWWTMVIPNDPKLLGVVFYNQCATVAPGANAAGLLWSNGGGGVIGVR